MPVFSCDFHIHSVLSPCAGLEMSPRNIVARAREVGLDIIAVTDHNMAENCHYVSLSAGDGGPLVLSGMELQTAEELHMLAIFGDHGTAMDLQRYVYDHIPPIVNDPEYFGDQVVVDDEDQIVRVEERLLLNSSTLTLNEAVFWVKQHGGLAIPSHVDAPAFSIISQLGFVPEGMPFDALEVVRMEKVTDIMGYIRDKNVPLVTFSDAHYLQDLGRRRIFLSMDEPGYPGVVKALADLPRASSFADG